MKLQTFKTEDINKTRDRLLELRSMISSLSMHKLVKEQLLLIIALILRTLKKGRATTLHEK